MWRSRHILCISDLRRDFYTKRRSQVLVWSESQLFREGFMRSIARKQEVPNQGTSVRERLRAMDDSAVVTAFLGGEERAFSELVERYQTRLLNFIYRTIGDREKAEDLVQEVFIRVYRHLHRFDRSKKLSRNQWPSCPNITGMFLCCGSSRENRTKRLRRLQTATSAQSNHD